MGSQKSGKLPTPFMDGPWGKFMGKINGENLWGRLMGKSQGEN